MALQTCKRCRKRRIKCDLQLPACTSCQLVDLECLYYDDSLGHDVPRSYLHALSKKVENLESTINAIKSPAAVVPSPSPFSQPDCPDPLQASPDARVSSASSLGIGTSAALLENLLRTLVQRSSTQNPSGLSKFAAKAREVEDYGSLPFPPLKVNFSKLDTQALQQAHLQRALIEYYAKTVQSSFSLLSAAQINSLLRYEHPLRQCTAAERLPIYGIFSLASALVARDLDRDQSITASMWTEKFHSYIGGYDNVNAHGEARMKQNILALCFLALLDLVSPMSSRGGVWEVVGAASRSYVKLLDDVSVSSPEIDEDIERLGHCIYLLESTLSIHFRIPSIYCNSALAVVPNRLSEHLVHHTLYNLTQHLNSPQNFAPHGVESLIPDCLRIHLGSGLADISLGQAQVYLTLHPLFTSPGAGIHCCSPDLLSKIAMAAAAFITHTCRLNKERRIVSIWVTAENVLQAGGAWAAYLMLQSQKDSPLHEYHAPNLFENLPAMDPIVKCSSLLASFAERWKGGQKYCQAWEAFTELLLADTSLSNPGAGQIPAQSSG